MRQFLITAGAGTVLLLVSLSAAAQGSGAPKSGSFADELFAEGDWFRAVTEYRRQIFESDDIEVRARAWYRIGEAYLRAGRFTEAFATFTRVTEKFGGTPFEPMAKYGVGLTYLEAGTSILARKSLAPLLEDTQVVSVVGRDRIRLAIAATWFEERKWEECASELEDFGKEFPHSGLLDAAAHLRARALQGPNLPRKSPLLAGMLSALIPGSGQVYDERWWDGVQAFIITGVFGAATAASIYAEYQNHYSDYVVPALIGSVFLVFYGANIYGAVNGARMTNAMAEYRHVGETRSAYLPLLRLPPSLEPSRK